MLFEHVADDHGHAAHIIEADPGTRIEIDAQLVRMFEVIGQGDITSEHILIINRGATVTLDRSDIEFGEINNSVINNEFDATILEVAGSMGKTAVEIADKPGFAANRSIETGGPVRVAELFDVGWR